MSMNRIVLKVIGDTEQVTEFVECLEASINDEYIVLSKSRLKGNDEDGNVHQFLDLVPRDFERWLQR
jgi:hypothetical protein